MYKSNRDIECEIMDRLVDEYGIDPMDILDNLLRYLDSDTTTDFLKDYCKDRDIDVSDITDDESDD